MISGHGLLHSVNTFTGYVMITTHFLCTSVKIDVSHSWRFVEIVEKRMQKWSQFIRNNPRIIVIVHSIGLGDC